MSDYIEKIVKAASLIKILGQEDEWVGVVNEAQTKIDHAYTGSVEYI